MNKTSKYLLMVIGFCALMISLLPTITFANAAEPPSLIILVKHPPDDLKIKLISGEDQAIARPQLIAWEGYYAFYSRDTSATQGLTFEAMTEGESFEFIIDTPLEHYHNVFTLNLTDQELTPGTYPFRTLLLVSLRLLLTLIIEAGAFWLFGFRQKKSWLIFLVVNLLTQGLLNIWLSCGTFLLAPYLILTLIFGEIFVFLAEIIILPLLIKEHQKVRIIVYALTANSLSHVYLFFQWQGIRADFLFKNLSVYCRGDPFIAALFWSRWGMACRSFGRIFDFIYFYRIYAKISENLSLLINGLS